jgi:hypothetical protein
VSRTYNSDRSACPSCKAMGRDSGNDHLRVFKDDPTRGWCYSENKVIHLNEEDGISTTYQKRPPSNDNRDTAREMALVATYPVRPYPDRRISQETMEFFGVRTAVHQEDASPAEHFYPYYDAEGQNITGYKCRTLPKEFRAIGKITTLFGQQKINFFKDRSQFLIIVEGEHDALAAHEMMKKLKPDRAPYNVISIPFGANEQGTVDKAVMSHLEWLSKFDSITICLDNDVNGRATANSLADVLVSQAKVKIASLPLKDTAALWEAGREKDWAQAINNAKPYVSEQIVLGSDTPLKELMVPLTRGIYFPFTPKTCSKLRGYRTRELNTIIAPPKVGKTSLIRQKTYHILATTNEQVGGFFLEETIQKTKQAIIAMHAGVALNDFRANPEIADKHLVQEAYDTLLPRLHLFTHKNKTISDDMLERKVDYMVKTLGCQRIILDHASFVLGTRDTKDERREIDMLLTKLARSVEDEDYTLWMVAHIKRGAREQSRSVRDQKYPYWEIMDSAAGRGSGSFEQLSHNMIAIEKQIMDPEGENTRGLVRTRILLAREWGVEGIGDYLRFDERGKFVPVEVDY